MGKYEYECVAAESLADISVQFEKIFECGAEIYKIKIECYNEADKDKWISFSVNQPMKKATYRWAPFVRKDKSMHSTWMGENTTMLALDCPVVTAYGEGDINECTVAFSETKRNMKIRSGYSESLGCFSVTARLPLASLGSRGRYEMEIYLDRTSEYIGKALDKVRSWWEKILDITPMSVPEAAKEPMYSSWYSYHQSITDKELEKEALSAAECGMKAIIVDDGWQTESSSGGYGYTGDWEVADSKIRDMKAHVARVHEAGLKYILWFSVPFVGYNSKVYESLKDKILYKNDGISAAVLDPRYPEVRKYLINIYKKFAVEYEIDGFKLDFVDSFYTANEPPKQEAMDYEAVCDATERLMTDVKEALCSINSDMLIEFRQRYTGPVIRKFGNMLRVGDCARDGLTNRVGISDIRMLSGKTAVHSDMIIFGKDEEPENAAWQIINSLFGVIQYSVRMDELDCRKKNMSKFWINFAHENKEVLLNSEFIAHEPHYNYPVIEAFDENERIVAVYTDEKIISLDGKTTKIINGSFTGEIYIKSDMERTVYITVMNCEGEECFSEERKLIPGVNIINAPVCGLIVIK